MSRPEVRPPSIACIGVVGREDQLLYSSLFPPYSDGKSDGSRGDSATSIGPSPVQAPTKPNSATAVNVAPIEFSLLIQSSLDAFEFRARDRSRVDQDVGLLNAIDERLSVWGWETPTGTKFVIVLDAWGLPDQPEGGDGDTRYLPGMGGGGGLAWGMKEGDLKPAFKALQIAYIRLLQNPFYTPDDHIPIHSAMTVNERERPRPIRSQRFAREVHRIGTNWKPGVVGL